MHKHSARADAQNDAFISAMNREEQAEIALMLEQIASAYRAIRSACSQLPADHIKRTIESSVSTLSTIASLIPKLSPANKETAREIIKDLMSLVLYSNAPAPKVLVDLQQRLGPPADIAATPIAPQLGRGLIAQARAAAPAHAQIAAPAPIAPKGHAPSDEIDGPVAKAPAKPAAAKPAAVIPAEPKPAAAKQGCRVM